LEVAVLNLPLTGRRKKKTENCRIFRKIKSQRINSFKAEIYALLALREKKTSTVLVANSGSATVAVNIGFHLRTEGAIERI
jgi:hypothetical protein